MRASFLPEIYLSISLYLSISDILYLQAASQRDPKHWATRVRRQSDRGPPGQGQGLGQGSGEGLGSGLGEREREGLGLGLGLGVRQSGRGPPRRAWATCRRSTACKASPPG
eukprot:scaffold119072_cov66-Phaeocystis_antarctica.AAC.1